MILNPRLTSDKALYAARLYMREGIDRYEYREAISQARTWLYLGDIEQAIYCTQVALFIIRLRKAMA